jgi:hypothetical protein
MTVRRYSLQELLEAITDNVYFQPPPNVQMAYPCIVYQRDRTSTRFADNKPYARTKGYQVTVIDRDPDSDIPDKVAQLPTALFSRFFVANNLNHDVYTLFF